MKLLTILSISIILSFSSFARTKKEIYTVKEERIIDFLKPAAIPSFGRSLAIGFAKAKAEKKCQSIGSSDVDKYYKMNSRYLGKNKYITKLKFTCL